MAYRDVFERLAPEAAAAIKVGNYEKLIVGARNKVRLYEKYCVDYAGLAIDIRQDNERPDPVKFATQAAIKDAVDYGLQMRTHDLDPKSPPPSAEHLKRLVPLNDLRQIATEVLPTGATPWTKVPSFMTYLSHASKL